MEPGKSRRFYYRRRKRRASGQKRNNAGNRPNVFPRAIGGKTTHFRARGGVRGFKKMGGTIENLLKKNDPLRNIGWDRIPMAKAGHRPSIPNVMGPMMNFPVPGRSPYVPLNGRMPEYLDIGRGHIQPPSSGIYGLPSPNRLFNG